MGRTLYILNNGSVSVSDPIRFQLDRNSNEGTGEGMIKNNKPDRVNTCDGEW